MIMWVELFPESHSNAQKICRFHSIESNFRSEFVLPLLSTSLKDRLLTRLASNSTRKNVSATASFTLLFQE